MAMVLSPAAAIWLIFCSHGDEPAWCPAPDVMVASPTVKSSCQVAMVVRPLPDRAKTANTDNKEIFKPGKRFMSGYRVRGRPQTPIC